VVYFDERAVDITI